MSHESENATQVDAALDLGLEALTAGDSGKLVSACQRLVELAAQKDPPQRLEARMIDVGRLTDALARHGAGSLARELLIASAPFVHGRDVDLAGLRRILSEDGQAVLRFVQRSRCDFESFGMDERSLVRVVREAVARQRMSPEDVLFALRYVRRANRCALAAVGLRAYPAHRDIWRAAADALLLSGEMAAAAVAYEQSLADPQPERSVEVIAALERPAPDGVEIVSLSRKDRRASPVLPSLVNVALIRRALDGPEVAREAVARHAHGVPPTEAALAFFDAGAGEDGLTLLIDHQRRVTPGGNDRGCLFSLSRLYFALGRTVESVAALRLLYGTDIPLTALLDRLFGSCMTTHRLRYRGRWGGAFPPDNEETIQAAALDALLAEQAPSGTVSEAAEAHCAIMRDGSPENRAQAIVALEALGPRCAPIVHRWIVAGGARMRARLQWLLERWAWQAADRRFLAATGIPPPPPSDFPPGLEIVDPGAGMRADLDAAIDGLRRAQVDGALQSVDRLYRTLADQEGPKLAAPVYRIGTLIDLLLAEEQRARARALVLALAGTRDAHVLLHRYRSLLADESEQAFDMALAQPTRKVSFEAAGLSADDVVRIACRRLDAGALPVAPTLRILSELGVRAANRVLRRALRRFPSSAALMAAFGRSLLDEERFPAALRVFERSARLLHERRSRVTSETANGESIDDPDQVWECDTTLDILSGYPPRLVNDATRTNTTNPAFWAAGIWNPLLVNLAILHHELTGHSSALAVIERYRSTTGPVIVAAALRAIGELDAARAPLEAEVRAHGTRTPRDVLNGIIGLYAGMDRLVDAIAVAQMVIEDQGWAHEHVHMLLGTLFLDVGDEELRDDVLAYEGRFVEERAIEVAIERLLATCGSSPEAEAGIRLALDRIGSEDFPVHRGALDELRNLGPVAARMVAEALPRMAGPRRADLQKLLQSWAWAAAEERLRAELGSTSP